MPGTVFKRCGCRDAGGDLLGAECPKLAGKNHGSWSYKVELPPGPDGVRRRAGKGGFTTKRLAEVALTDLLDKVNKRTHVGTGNRASGTTSSSGSQARRPCGAPPPRATASTSTCTCFRCSATSGSRS
jgi:hypothetical protein